MRKKDSIGPFKDALESAQSFGYGMYYHFCLLNTLEEMAKIEEEYQLALSSSNVAMIADKEGQLAFYENILLLATDAYRRAAFDSFESGSLND